MLTRSGVCAAVLVCIFVRSVPACAMEPGDTGTAAAARTPIAAHTRTGLASLKSRIESGAIPNVHAVIAVSHGRKLVDWYFTGRDRKRDGTDLGIVAFRPETLHDVRSVSKSVVSLLFGIALHEGLIGSVDDPVIKYFPEYADLDTPQLRRITLRHLLTMSSGLHWDEYTFPYTDPRNSETAMDLAEDRYRYVLSQPIDFEAGTRFNYNGGNVALIAALVARAAHMPIEHYAQLELFGPMGITRFDWVKDKKGIPIAASGLRLAPRDMLKIGLFMLHHGRSNGRQIVPRTWVDDATRRHIAADSEPACGTDYGYFWWLGPGCPREGLKPWFGAIGNGGQRIWVVPSRELVIVTTAGSYDEDKQAYVSLVVQGIEKAIQ